MIRGRYVICGPQGAGKSTFVEKHARLGDYRWDLDHVAACLTTGTPVLPADLKGQLPQPTLELVMQLRETFLTWVGTVGQLGNWGLLDVTQSKKLKETDPNSYYMVWEGKDFKSRKEAEAYRNNYKGSSKLVIKNMQNWEGAEIYGEEIAWDGLTEEEFESEYEKTCTDQSRPKTWKQICIHIEDWELRQKIRPLVTELEGC